MRKFGEPWSNSKYWCAARSLLFSLDICNGVAWRETHYWKSSVAKEMLMLYCDARACTYMIDSWRDWNGIYQPMTDNVLPIKIQLHTCRADVHLFNKNLILFLISCQCEVFFILTAIQITWTTYTMEMKCMYYIFYLTIKPILLPRHTALKFMFCCGVT